MYEFNPVNAHVPVPLFVTVPVPVAITLLSVAVPEPCRVILVFVPDIPPLNVNAPPPEASKVTPVPVKEMARADECPVPVYVSCVDAAIDIVGVEEPVPKELFEPASATVFTLNIPVLIVTAPEKVFEPVKAHVPAPLFVSVPVVVPITPLTVPSPEPVSVKLYVFPPIFPAKVTVAPEPDASIVAPLPVKVIALSVE